MSRWERLFEDLAAQAAAAEAAELAGDIDDRTRFEVGSVRLADRLRAAVGRPVRIGCVGGASATGAVREVGVDWMLVGERPDDDALVGLRTVASIAGLGAVSAPASRASPVAQRLDLRYMLRGLARDRAGVRMALTDCSDVAGTIDRVGADFIDVAEHPVGEARRARDVRGVRAVVIGAVAVVRVARWSGA
jgi:hypothetical protein